MSNEIRYICKFGHETGADLSEVASPVDYLVEICHGASARAGWWTVNGIDCARLLRNADIPASLEAHAKWMRGLIVSQKLCLAHSEISEAMEGDRKGLQDDKLPQYPMVGVEIADAIIRLADLAGAMGLPLGEILAAKLAFNAQRPDHKKEAREAAGGKAY